MCLQSKTPDGYRVVKFDCLLNVEAVYNLSFPRAVVHNEPDTSEARRQLQHAKEERDLAGQYPGQKATTPTLGGGQGVPDPVILQEILSVVHRFR